MAEPCKQAEKIGRMEATLEFFQAESLKRETREERIATALEQIANQGAAQGATIAAHGETLIRFEKSFMEAFLRLRKVEGSRVISRIFSGKRGPFIFAGLCVGSTYGVFHLDAQTLAMAEKLIKLFK